MIQMIGGKMMFSQELTGWIDKDRHLLAGLSLDDKIDYFEKRVRLVAINPLSRMTGQFRNEIDGLEDSSTLLIVGVALCCCIEATGKFVNGGRSDNRGRFHEFLNRYMSSEFRSPFKVGMTYGDVLWKYFRNGIAHGFAVSHGGFDGNDGKYFVEEDVAGRKRLMISPYRLYEDFSTGFDAYLNDLRSEPSRKGNLREDFEKVFNDVFVKGK